MKKEKGEGAYCVVPEGAVEKAICSKCLKREKVIITEEFLAKHNLDNYTCDKCKEGKEED